MVEKRGRLGRKNGKGFYDYPQNERKKLWPGLVDLQPSKLDSALIDAQELKQRLLAIQALETARCVEEGVITAYARPMWAQFLALASRRSRVARSLIST